QCRQAYPTEAGRAVYTIPLFCPVVYACLSLILPDLNRKLISFRKRGAGMRSARDAENFCYEWNEVEGATKKTGLDSGRSSKKTGNNGAAVDTMGAARTPIREEPPCVGVPLRGSAQGLCCLSCESGDGKARSFPHDPGTNPF